MKKCHLGVIDLNHLNFVTFNIVNFRYPLKKLALVQIIQDLYFLNLSKIPTCYKTTLISDVRVTFQSGSKFM